MVYLFGALAVFYVLSIAENYLELPRWAWQVSTLVLSVGVWLLIDDGSDWWMPLAVAGMVVLAKATEALLLVASDRARVEVLRGTRR